MLKFRIDGHITHGNHYNVAWRTNANMGSAITNYEIDANIFSCCRICLFASYCYAPGVLRVILKNLKTEK